jgi:ABC-2 type transport system ATP-binding protein
MSILEESKLVASEFEVEPAIRISGLSKRFKKSMAVNRASFIVQPGDVFGLLGPNGAGKTTIIRMLLGLIRPTDGRATVLGFDPVQQRSAALQRVAAIVEAPALYPGLTARDNLRAMALASGLTKPEQRIDEVLELLGLQGRSKDKFKAFSLGMKQRLCIAATLLTDPQLIILDEPTNGLDPAGMAEVRQLIKDLAATGRTVLLSSHLLHEVQQICNRVAVIQRGQIIVEGLVSELLAGKSSIRVKVLPDEWESANQILQKAGWAGRLSSEEGYLVVAAEAHEGRLINQALVSQGIFANEVTLHNQSLEEYYLDLTGPSAVQSPAQEQGQGEVKNGN